MTQKKENFITKISRYADAVEVAIASVAFAFMCIFVLTTIVYRYILHEPISWTEEASRYLMIVGIFFAMPVAVRDHVHLGVDIFIGLIPVAGKKIVHVFSDIVTLLAYLAIDYLLSLRYKNDCCRSEVARDAYPYVLDLSCHFGRFYSGYYCTTHKYDY